MAKAPLEFEAKVSAGELNQLLRELSTGAQGAAKAINDALGGNVTKKLVIETQADEKGIKRLVAVEKERLSVANAIENQQKQINKVQAGSLTSLRQQVNEALQARDAISKYKKAIDSIGNSSKQLNEEWVKQNQRVRELRRGLDDAGASGFWEKAKSSLNAGGFISFLNGLTEITQGLQSATIVIGQITGSINTLINASAELQSFALSFKAIGSGAAGANEALNESARIALGLGTSLETVQDGFRQLSPVVLNSGGSLDDVSGIVEALSSRFAAFGISGDKARRVTNGVIQAFAKGKLQAEELTQQISEADPAFKTDLAGALKISVAELEKFVKAGKITSQVLIDVLPDLSKSILLFGKLGPSANSAIDALERNAVTIDQVRNNLDNLNKLSLRNIAQVATPLINAFLRAQAIVTDFFARISQASSVQTLASILGRLVNVLNSALDAFFAVAEGAVKVLDAIAPFIDVILKIPGAVELAGAALIGKFLKPLNLLEGALSRSIRVQQQFVGRISAIWGGSQRPILAVKNAINGVTEALEQKPSLNLLKSTSQAVGGVAGDTKSAVESIKSIEPAIAGRIQTSIEKTESKIDRLRKRLRLIELDSQIAAPTAPTKAVVDNKITRQLGQTSEAFQQTLKNLERYQSGILGFAKDAKSARDNIGVATLAIRELKNELGEPVFGRAKVIRPEFLRDVKELAKTDPAKATTLLQSALRSLRVEARNTETALKGLTDEGRISFKAQVAESANQVKAAIAGIVQESKKIDTKTFDNLSSAQASLGIDILKTKAEAIELRAELAREPNDRLSKKVGNDQAAIRAELDKTLKKQQALYAELEKVRSARQTARREAVGFEPGKIQESTNNLEKYSKAVQETKQQEIIASNSRISEIDKSLAASKKALDDIQAKQKQFAQSSQQFRVPIGPIEINPGDAEQAQKLRNEISSLTNERSKLVQQAAAQASAETNLNKILEEGSRVTSTYAERQKALNLSRDILVQSLRSTGKEAAAVRDNLKKLEADKANLLKQQAARPFFGQVDVQTDGLSKGIRDLSTQIAAAKQQLAGLEEQRSRSFQGLQKLQDGFQQNERTADTFRGQIGRLQVGFSNFFRGLTISPIKAFGGALASAGGAAFAFLQSIGPLPAILLAIGVASRAYADGTRESADISKRFADRTEQLKLALSDLNPEADTTSVTSSKLGRTWEALSLTVANLGDAIGGFLESLATGFEGLISKLKGLLGPLYEVLGAAALVAGPGGLGALIGLGLGGPWGAAIGAALGVATGALVALGLSADETSIKMEKLKRNTATTAKSIEEQIPAFQDLVKELSKLAAPGGGVEPKNLPKFIKGVREAEKAIEDQNKQIQDQRAALSGSEKNYQSNINRLGSLRKQLEKATSDFNALDRASGAAGGAPGSGIEGTVVPGLEEAREKMLGLQAEIRSLEESTIKLGTTNNATAATLQQLEQKLESARKAYKKLREENGLVTEEQKNLINSVNKFNAAIKELEEGVGDFDLFSPKGRENLRAALAQAEGLKTVLDELTKTEIEISIELRDIEQSIAESTLKIDLDPGPIREAALAVSKITNSFATAQQEFQRTVAEVEYVFNQETTNAKTRKDIEEQKAAIIEKAAKQFLASSQEAKAEIIEAGRQFKDQLDKAKSAYSSLVLDTPGFFTPGEIRENAKQIEADFITALNKVRAETGDWSWGPRLEGNTYDEILKQKKEFIDTRKEAETLQKSIRELNAVLSLLAVVLAKISGTSFDELKKLGLDPEKIISNAQKGQQAITGLGNAAKAVAKQYGDVVGTIEADGKKIIITTVAATGEVVQLSEAEYKAARGAKELGKAGSEAMNTIGEFASGAANSTVSQAAATKVVIGELEAGGQKLFLIQDTINGKVEEVTQSQLNQLGVVNKLSSYFDQLGVSISSAGEKTGEYLKRERELNQSVSPRSTEIGLEIGIPPDIVESVREAGAKAGGNWLKALAETVAQGEVFPSRVLQGLANSVTEYKAALETLAISQNQAKQAQMEYDSALVSGSSNLLTAAGGVENANAALEASENAARSASIGYNEASEAARLLGIDINTVMRAGTIIPDTGPTTLEEAYSRARDKAIELYNATQDLGTSSDAFESGTGEAETSLSEGVGTSEGISNNLDTAARQAEAIAVAIQKLDGLNVNVNVTGVPGLWTGGPAIAGKTYQVNELGQEGFLSAGGRLSAINKPKNALWRAPSSGTVIPAHIWAGLDVPAGGVRTTAKPMTATGGNNGLHKVVRAIQASLSGGTNSSAAMHEMASVQARQAIEIGKLSRAVNKLADKDHTVNVAVRNTGSTAYLDALNRRL